MLDRTSSTMPRWLSPVLVGCILLGVGYACASIALAASGGTALPPPVDAIITTTIAYALVGLFVYRSSLQTLARIDLAEYRLSQHYVSMERSLMEHGFRLEATTGEILKIRICPMLPPDNVEAFELGRQSERNIRALR